MGNDISRQKADGVGARRFEGIIKAFFAASYEGIDEGVAFLEHLRERHGGRLNVIWDNAPAHRGEGLREYLRTSDLGLPLANLPGYSPDFNADEAIWDWTREEAIGNLCLDSRAAVQQWVGRFLAGLSSRKEEVQRCGRTVLQSRARHLCKIPSPTPGVRQMHIPPWPWAGCTSFPSAKN